ncbi:MAG: sulfatase-like hydrolase/transferase [Methanothrix sp.]|nr:sulfatase-like hydrolase/transferase [Methanothrix sp.]
MAFLVFLFAIVASDCFAADNDSAGVSDALATSDSQSVSQTLAADARSSSSTGSLEKSGLEMLTNRRKVLTESSTLADIANEDVVSPQETVLVIQAANSKSSVSDSQQNDSNCDKQKIGLTYKDSIECWPEKIQPPKGAPNVVYIVLDDVGFAHLGCFGGPIETPNIDRLAEGGLRYSNFHTTALCSPSRACFMTGRNHHSTGIGALTDMAVGYPGYNGNLSKNTATLAEMLQGVGYNTFALGKWHLVSFKDINSEGPFDNWPTGRGFDHFYGFLPAQTNQWTPDLVQDTKHIDPPATPEEGYHLSNDLVDQAIRYVDDQQSAEPDKPYLMYLAFGACHSPHHAPQEYIDKYKGKFDQGWDVVRNETLARQKEMGIVPANTELPPRNPGVKAWDSLSADEKRLFARMMEVYAGFLDHTDEQIGRLIDYLDETDQLNNTMIILTSDNGASMEGSTNGSFSEYMLLNQMPEENVSFLLTKIDELGGPMTFPHYPMGWAMAGNTPFKLYKQWTHEGGVHDPLIIYYPAEIKDKGAVRTQFTHAIDIVPTILEVVGIEAPEVYKGIPQKPVEGVSMAYTFDQPDAQNRKDVQYFAMWGSRGLWYDGWKAVTMHPHESGGNFDQDVWELYNLSQDVSEVHNLAQENPGKVQEMVERWWAEAGKYNVLPLDDRSHMEVPPGPTGKFTYHPGMTTIFEPGIPDTKESSYTINADVEIPDEGAEGVLLSIGGRFGGLSLYVQDKHLVFDYNYVGLSHVTITSVEEVPSGPSTLGFSFDKTGEADFINHTSATGIGTLFINGKEVAKGTIAPTVPARYSWEEGLEIGTDRLTPVTESYMSPFEFTGTLKKVELEVKD